MREPYRLATKYYGPLAVHLYGRYCNLWNHTPDRPMPCPECGANAKALRWFR